MQNIDLSKLRDNKILLNGNPYPVEIRRSYRRTFGITIRPEMEIIFHLPIKTNEQTLEEFAQKKKKWIAKQLTFFEQFQPRTPERRYVSGETHLFLGREYRLRLISSDHWKISVSRYYINVYTPDKLNKQAIAKHLSDWYRTKANNIFKSRSKLLKQECGSKLGYWISLSGVKKMKSKWGIYDQASQTYILNSELIKAPIMCIDYVILHEVLHRKYLNHNRNFFAMMNKLMPDWKQWKNHMEIILK